MTAFDWSKQRVLVVAPHPDDEALGCGGLISRVKRAGGQVFVLYMTIADIRDYSAAGFSTAEQRRREFENCAAYFALDGWHLAMPGTNYNLRLDDVARAELIDLLERPGHPLALPTLEPTVVLTPDATSYNQDHRAVAHAVISALRPGPSTFRHQPLLVLAYEQVADSWTSDPPPPRNFYVELTDEDLDRKIAALKLHTSQWREHPHTRSEPALRGLAALRGAQSGYRYAEAFHCLRWRA